MMSSVKGLAELFKCFICMGELKNTHLCPHCSKPCCYSCIRKWLIEQKPQCPHCRKHLIVIDLVNCRWIEDVTQQIDTLQEIECNQKKEMCNSHNEKLTVFCWDCKQCICHQCALWDELHTNHVFKPLEEVYLLHVGEIEKELNHLRERQSELEGYIKETDKCVKSLKIAKSKQVNEIMESSRQIVSRLEEQFEGKLIDVNVQRSLFLDECSKIELFLKSSEQQVKTYHKSQLLSSSKRIMENISEFYFCNQVIKKPENLYAVVDTEFLNELVPPYNGSSFVISNFSILKSKSRPVYSEPLQAAGLTWRLKVYPAGNSSDRGKYLSVFFELTSGFPETSKYQYRVEMISQEGDSVIREFTSDFDAGECWGFNRFYLLDLLENEGYLNAKDDTLVLKFQVRSVSYCQKSRDQDWHIKQLQAAQDIHVKRIQYLESILKQSNFSTDLTKSEKMEI